MCYKINRYIRGDRTGVSDEETWNQLDKYYGDLLVEGKNLIKKMSEETGEEPDFTLVNRLSKSFYICRTI